MTSDRENNQCRAAVKCAFLTTCTTTLRYLFLLMCIMQHSAYGQQLNCNILDPRCRERYQNNFAAAGTPNQRQLSGKCTYSDVWLIPGKADTSCSRPGSKKLLDIDTSSITITPEVIKLPGCFTIEIKNMKVLDLGEAVRGVSFFGKAEYQWWNLRQFSELKCQNASNNGCGGYGNNWLNAMFQNKFVATQPNDSSEGGFDGSFWVNYYCDICDSLTQLGEGRVAGDGKQRKLTEQFRGLNCPREAGQYVFRKQFCFNDWSAFDTDQDCSFDFLQKIDKDNLKSFKTALQSFQQVGYGTVVGKFRLAHNATGSVLAKKLAKEKQIEETVGAEMEARRRSWDEASNGNFQQFKPWYIQYRKDLWHKEDYLPWLLYENEAACIRVTFDVCDRQPTRARSQTFTTRGGGNWPKFTCEQP